MKNIVISKDKINRKFRKKELGNYFVLFIEVSNLHIYSQYYDITISEKIIKQLYRDLINIFNRNNVFLYSSDDIVIIQEFENKVIVDKQVRYDEQRRLAQNIINYISNQRYSLDTSGQYYKASLTIGVSSRGLIHKEKDIASLIRLAHFSMIKAKEQGKSIIVANDEIRIIKQDVDDFNYEMESGFKLDEFSPFFMPVINPRSLRIVGCESLVRWTKDKYRVIEAAKFRDIAIEKNLLEKIDERVIEKTFLAYLDWERSGLTDDNFRITINLSKNSLVKFRFYDIMETLDKYNIKPQNIEFDISLDDGLTQEELNAVTRLKAKGFNVACDVLNSNRLSLPMLTNIDVSTIKFGMVSRSLENYQDRARNIYEALINVAKNLNYQIMAKGIENRETLEFVKEMNVELVQGYYFTKPLDENNFKVFLKKFKNGIN